MTDALYPAHGFLPDAPDRPEAASRSAPVHYAPPVFITDCATPLGGETLLSLVWRRLNRAD